MSELISGKEAKLAWANGRDVEFYSEGLETWFSLKDDVFLSDVFDTKKLRIKPQTITLNGIGVPRVKNIAHSGGNCVTIVCHSIEDAAAMNEALRSVFK